MKKYKLILMKPLPGMKINRKVFFPATSLPEPCVLAEDVAFVKKINLLL